MWIWVLVRLLRRKILYTLHLCWGEQVVVTHMVWMAMGANLQTSDEKFVIVKHIQANDRLNPRDKRRTDERQNLTRWVTSSGVSPSPASEDSRSSLSQGERVSTNTTSFSPIWSVYFGQSYGKLTHCDVITAHHQGGRSIGSHRAILFHDWVTWLEHHYPIHTSEFSTGASEKVSLLSLHHIFS